MAPPPQTFSEKVSDGTDTVTVDFNLHPIRSSNFEVLVQDGNGNINTHTAAPPRTYLGTVQGHPGALASGLLKENGTLLCRISFESGVEWSSTGGIASVRGSTNWKLGQWPTGKEVAKGGAGSIVFAAEVGVDASYQQYIAANSNVDDTVEIVEFSVMAVNVVYLRDAAILHRIGKLVVRSSKTTDPYITAGGDTNLLLNEVKKQWNHVLPVGTTHHLALVVRPGAGGGLAWVGSIGTSNRYSSNGANSNGDFSVLWRHEAGHNWGSNHYEGGGKPEGPTIMSDNALSRFSSSELVKILAQRNAKTNILEELGPYSFPIPPRANMDRAEFIVSSPVTLDVLANDSDSNGQALTLLSFPSQSARSAILTRSFGTGGSKRDEIIYTPPVGLASGIDHFSYRIADAAGKTATGYVTLRPVFDDELVAHWPFNDGTGTIALDTTSRQNHGTISGGATWVTGHIGGAIRLNGIDGQVATMPLHVNTNTVTIAGWVKRNGSQASWAGLAFTRGLSGTAVAGLNLGTSNELRYHWGAGKNPSYNFNSHLTLPDATWTFCALSISPTYATIYMMPIEESLQSATATGTFSPQSFEGTFYLGYDPSNATRRFKGDMDDFRVFQRTLSTLEITSLANDGGTPSAPSPVVNGNKLVGSSFNLNWTPAPSSTSYLIYLGTSYISVRDATTTSSEYVESTTSTTFNPGSLPVGTWFWRVDANDSTTIMKGPVWYFTIVTQFPGLVGWWKMDEGCGMIVKDSSNSGANGTISGAVWGSDGLVFSGNGKIACGTAASLNGTTSFSVCAWVKVPTTHNTGMVIIQQRGPASSHTNGYNGQYQLRVNAAGKPAFFVFGNGATQFNFDATTTIHDNLWHHVLAVRDGTEGRIYIDGAVSGSASGALRRLVSNIPVFMGCDARNNTQFFNGSLKDVHIFNQALSDEEIRDLINRGPEFTSDVEPMICHV